MRYLVQIVSGTMINYQVSYRLDPQSKLNDRIYEHRAWWSHKPSSISFNKKIRLKSD
jgi:hypothetical protein